MVVLSEDLIEEFKEDQIKVMLAHELAHIKRKDSIKDWVSLILRDVLFFNPISRFAYYKLEEEKEKACDRMALEVAKLKSKDIANTLLDVAIFYKKGPSNQGAHPSPSSGFSFKKSVLERRVDAILRPTKIRKRSRIRVALRGVVLFLLFYLQFGIILLINGYPIYLR